MINKDLPSEETLRLRLDEISQNENSLFIVDDMVVNLLENEKLGRIHTVAGDLIPIDIDVSVLADPYSHKEDIGWTYKKVNGYAPIFAYIGTEGYMLANELRPGTQHSAKGAIQFIHRCIDLAVALGYSPDQFILRLDSGHDDSEFIGKLETAGVKYLVKRNPRREIPAQVLDTIRSSADIVKNRKGKMTYTEKSCNKMPPGLKNYKGFIVIEAVERTILSDGQTLLLSEIEVASWWINLFDNSTDCIQLYHDHATSEQFHAELKTDMIIELLPSGKKHTNALILALANMSFNLLRIIGQSSLKVRKELKEDINVKRIRLKTVIRDYINVACKIVKHAKQIFYNFGCACKKFNIMKGIDDLLIT